MFISLEGIDGIGKSTQLKKLVAAYKKASKVYVTKEPGDDLFGSNIGPGIRALLFSNPTAKEMAPGVADLLFLADHIQNSYEISKMLEEGYLVISDRYADSQFAYTGGSSKKCPEWAIKLYLEQYGVRPDLIIYYRADNLESGWPLLRARSRKGSEVGKQEGKPWNDIKEQETIQSSYDKWFSLSTDRVAIVNVAESDTPDDVYKKSVIEVAKLAKLKIDSYTLKVE